jgi:L-ascorbate metabolism protein UlaG (beta-lactamase superfamily)
MNELAAIFGGLMGVLKQRGTWRRRDKDTFLPASARPVAPAPLDVGPAPLLSADDLLSPSRSHHDRFMKTVLSAFLLLTHCALGGLDDYPGCVVADETRSHRGIRITYLGVNGYQFETGGHALLVDPYFTRTGLGAVALDRPIQPDAALVARGLALGHVPKRVDAVLVTHAHFDHLLDVPPVMRRTGARLVSGPSAVNLVRSLGIPRSQCRLVQDGSVRRIGPWTIRVLAAQHDRLLGSVPMPGVRAEVGSPPVKPSAWVVGEPLAFIVEAAGRRIYVESGGVPDVLPPETPVDLAILGVALPDARRHFAPAVRRLHPRFILPSHQDDFFLPFDGGFRFGKMTDFPQVLRTWEHEQMPGQLILLDYFRPWTLR